MIAVGVVVEIVRRLIIVDVVRLVVLVVVVFVLARLMVVVGVAPVVVILVAIVVARRPLRNVRVHRRVIGVFLVFVARLQRLHTSHYDDSEAPTYPIERRRIAAVTIPVRMQVTVELMYRGVLMVDGKRNVRRIVAVLGDPR